MKSIDKLLAELLLHSEAHLQSGINEPTKYAEIKQEILSRFQALDSALTEAVNLNTGWCKEIVDLQAKVKELEALIFDAEILIKRQREERLLKRTADCRTHSKGVGTGRNCRD